MQCHDLEYEGAISKKRSKENKVAHYLTLYGGMEINVFALDFLL